MNYPSRLLLSLSSLAVTGYIAVLSSVAFIPSASAAIKKQPVSKATTTSNKSDTDTHAHKNNQGKDQPADQNDDDQDEDGLNNDNKNPTQSLFEAINIGSLQAARDALNRGADLHAANVLGQTPLDMSIDLNRDRITFLLLSMRGYNNSPQKLDKNATTEMQTVAIEGNNKGHLSIKGSNQKNSALISNRKNAYIPDNGGVPKPEIGFLGFQKS